MESGLKIAKLPLVIVGLVNEAAGCEHTLTFDRSLKRVPQFKVI